MSFVLETFAQTPIWVFALFGVLIWRGVWMMRDRRMPRARLFITPLAFMALGIVGLLQQPHNTTGTLAAWVIGFGLVLPIGLICVPRDLRRVEGGRMVFMPGSVWPLVRFMIIFWTQYVMGVASGMTPEGGADIHLLAALVSGATAGFFAGTMFQSAQRTRLVHEAA